MITKENIMKVACLQENLKKGLSIVNRAVASRSTLPVLLNVSLSTDGGRLKLVATNLDIAVTCYVGAVIEKEGGFTIPSKLLSDLVNNLPNKKIELNIDNETATASVNCDRTKASIKGIDIQDYPIVPSPENDATESLFSLSASSLKTVISSVAGAAATDDTRPVLQGILMKIRGMQVDCVATDGYRLAIKTILLDKTSAEDRDLVIPATALSELSRIANSEDTIDFMLTEKGNHLIATTGAIHFVTRLIEGRFPDYERIIPKETIAKVTVNVAEFIASVKRASIFAVASGNVLKLTATKEEDTNKGVLEISGNISEIGSNREDLEIDMIHNKGETESVIALNAAYVMNALSGIDEEYVDLHLSSSAVPGVFRPQRNDTFLYLIMPMSAR